MTVLTAGTAGRHTVGEFHFTDALAGRRPTQVEHGPTLRIDRRNHGMATGIDIGQVIFHQVASRGPVPQMVMRVDDGQLRLQCGLAHLRQPFLANRQVR
nr:hypothetical protein [Pseudomonas sp. UBA4194]